MRPILPLLLAPFLLAGHPVSDANKDGEISLGEFIARVDIIFAKADVDFDGVLDQDERAALYDLQMEADAMDKFRLADADEDGRLDEAEWLSTLVRMEDLRAIARKSNEESVEDADGNFDEERWKAQMESYLARMERTQARAEALAGVTGTPTPSPDSRTVVSNVADASETDSASVNFLGRSADDYRMTPERYRSQKIFSFLDKDRDENNALTLEEWQHLGLYAG